MAITDEYLPLDALLPDTANYNQHSGESVARLASQIVSVGFTAPFLVDAKTKLIAAGHRRRLALLKLKGEGHAEPEGVRPGWLVPCRVGEWSELQRLKVLVGDNPDPAALDYDTEALTALLSELSNAGELEGSGYDEARLEALIGELAGETGTGGGESGLLPEADPDEVPITAPERVQDGDIWQLGEHRLICGDSTDHTTIERLLEGRPVDCMLTDPPYGLGDTESVKNNYDTHDDTRDNLRRIIAAILPIGERFAKRIVLTPGNGNQWLYPEPSWIMAWFTPAGVGRGPWGFCCWQPILCYGKDPRLEHGEGCHPDALSHTEASEKLGHPCSKPVKFWTWLLERATAQGGDILEPFAGSGTGFIAAEELGRRCYGVELSHRYCDIILARWEKATGREAVLLERVSEPALAEV